MSKAHPIELLPADAFGWYFTGLTDGEGCFRMSPANTRISKSWQVHFSMTLRADEIEHLTAIAARLGCGRIYYRKAPKRILPGSPNTQPSVTWNINRIADHALIVVPHFERYPLQFKKARDFLIWKTAIPLLYEISQRSKKGKPFGTKLITASENQFFDDIFQQLRSVREYCSSTRSIAPVPPRLP